MPALPGYGINLAGSLAGVGAFALMSWLELPPVVWFGVAFLVALVLLERVPLWVRLGFAGALGAAARRACTCCRGDDLVAVLQDHRPSGRARKRSWR